MDRHSGSRIAWQRPVSSLGTGAAHDHDPAPFRLVAVAAAILALGLTSAGAQQTAPAEATGPVVHCYDEARGAVARVLASECAGKVVSEEEAKAIRGQRAQAIQRAIQGREQPVFTDKRMVSVGTGFFVADGGRVVTNRHVVEKCDALTVETTTGVLASAKLIRFDNKLDIALIQANLASPATAVFQPRDTIQPGGSVAVIGYPDQGLPPRRPLMTLGATVPLDRELHATGSRSAPTCGRAIAAVRCWTSGATSSASSTPRSTR